MRFIPTTGTALLLNTASSRPVSDVLYFLLVIALFPGLGF
jgi:hypothetical protein